LNDSNEPTISGNVCMICGTNPPRAAWHGHAGIYVCRSCAIDVLPALIADAILLQREE
jgi:hypothetical protein